MDTIELKGQRFRYAFLGSENFGDLCTLFKNVYGASTTVKHLKKKYAPIDPGFGYFGCFIYTENNTPVGFQGALPYRFENGNTEIIGAQSCDSMTDPRYVRLGIFSFLAQKVDEQLLNKGIKFIYGFPNQNSEGILFGKLGWTRAGRMTLFSLSTGALPLANIGAFVGFFISIYQKWALKRLQSCGQPLVVLKNSEARNSALTVLHDRSFFHTKQKTSHIVLRIRHGSVWLKLGRELLVGDMALDNKGSLQDFLAELRLLARKIGVRKINFQCQRDGSSHKLLNSVLEGKASWHVGYKSFDKQLEVKELVFTYGDLDTF